MHRHLLIELNSKEIFQFLKIQYNVLNVLTGEFCNMYITKLLEDHRIPTNIDINERLWAGRFYAIGASLRFICRSRLYFKSGQIARPMRITRARAHKTFEKHPTFRAHKLCLVEKEKSLDVQVYSRISKTIKKL